MVKKLLLILSILILLSFYGLSQKNLGCYKIVDTTVVIIPSKIKIVDTPKVSKIDSFICFWEGKPYKYGGLTQKGIDCSGFTQKIFNDVFSINIPRTAYEQYKKAIKIPLEKLQKGDLIFFISKFSPSGWHVAYYLGDNKIFHAANKHVGIVIEELKKETINRIYAIGRYINN